MTYAFIQDVPADEQIYGRIREQLGEQPPAGLIAHIALKRDGGLRYVDVWESEQTWRSFHDETLRPAVESVLAGFGIAADESKVRVEAIDVIDAWVQAPAAVG